MLFIKKMLLVGLFLGFLNLAHADHNSAIGGVNDETENYWDYTSQGQVFEDTDCSLFEEEDNDFY